MGGFDDPTKRGTHIQYGVRYLEYGDAVVPFVSNADNLRESCDRISRQENRVGGIRTEVVARQVIYGDWVSADAFDGPSSSGDGRG